MRHDAHHFPSVSGLVVRGSPLTRFSPWPCVMKQLAALGSVCP